jgi:hypothetical protein
VGNLYHDACAVASAITRLSTAMFHVLQHPQCIIDKFVALASMNVYNHAHATCIVFVLILVQASICLAFHNNQYFFFLPYK